MNLCWIFPGRRLWTGCSTKGAAHSSFHRGFEIATLGSSCKWILPVLWIKLFKHWIYVEFLLVEGYVQGALRKDLLMAPSIERFITATLGRSYRCILSVLGTICKNIAFLLNFCWWKAIYRVLYERSYALLLSQSVKTASLGRSYWWILPVLGINWLKHWISSDFLLIQSYLQGAQRKELCIAPFVERFKITTLGRSYW